MTRSEKHARLLRKLATRQPFCATNTKQDGKLRRWRGQYQGGPIRGTMALVQDLDINAVRWLNLATVRTFGLIRERA